MSGNYQEVRRTINVCSNLIITDNVKLLVKHKRKSGVHGITRALVQETVSMNILSFSKFSGPLSILQDIRNIRPVDKLTFPSTEPSKLPGVAAVQLVFSCFSLPNFQNLIDPENLV